MINCNKENDLLQLKFDVVKHIIDTRLSEQELLIKQVVRID